ncbi:acyl--CoA ligase [Gluconobacter sp. Dm-62]|uniref:class I adenylate-forming enzyme family protein n=1 Tax=Gluconobacter sp. Dm-62 TaxID=2799804 RepID=UPI001B8C586C|nr:class I adenylate-forming enzyme family protein [Gluconobacter sp. Dm-62]MBS1103496.1 acyl--CoA ligase [Gluconobacter sp. Dm-62]
MTLGAFFSRASTQWPDATAMQDLTSGQRLTFAEVGKALAGFGAFLVNRSIPQGARIGILADASIPYLIADYGAMANGYVRVPLDPSLSPLELKSQIADAGIALLLYGSTAAIQAQDLTNAPCLPLPNSWDETAPPLPLPTGDDLASLNYTGGTTGQPKAVMHTQGSLSAVVTNISLARPTSPQDVLLNVRPLWPIASVSVLAHLCSGGTIVLGGRFNPATFLSTLERTAATFSSLVPTQISRLIHHESETPSAPKALPHFRSLDVGAAALSSEILDKATSLLGPRLSILYGMTEAPWSFYLPAPVLAALRQTERSAGAVGFALETVKGRLTDPDTLSGAGEVEISGPHLMAGYWKRPDLTAATLQNGWLRTGDLGELDPQELLRIVGRRKEIIRTGGMSVQPSEVAETLLDHTAVQDAHVFGLPDPEWGERICAVVVLHSGQSVSAEQLVEYCKTVLSRHKVPKQIQFVSHLPRSHYGKVQQGKLLEILKTDVKPQKS